MLESTTGCLKEHLWGACLATSLEVFFPFKSDFSIGPMLFLLPLMAFDSGTFLELPPRHRSLFWQPCNARLLSGF